RVARGGGAVQAGEEAGGDRGARAADPRDKRERLDETDRQGVAGLDLLDVALLGREPLGGEHHEREDDQRAADYVEVARPGLDLVAEQEPEDRDRDRAEDDEPAHAVVVLGLANAPVAQPAQPRGGDPPEVAPE